MLSLAVEGLHNAVAPSTKKGEGRRHDRPFAGIFSQETPGIVSADGEIMPGSEIVLGISAE